MAAADGLDLSDLESAPQASDAANQAKLDLMRRDYEKVAQLAGKLPPERAAEAWRRFLVTYADELPGSDEDDGLRTKARAAMSAAVTPVAIAASTADRSASAALPPRLAEQVSAYRAAKRVDLSTAQPAAKVEAWSTFLSACADDVAGSTRDDEQRERARQRLAHWTASLEAKTP